MSSRRHLLLGGLAAAFGTSAAQAQQKRSLTDPLRVAVDRALFDSGLAVRLQKAFGRDTGIAVKLETGPASALLEALERGEFDAALSNAPGPELQLEKEGLLHDRRAVALGRMVLVGPAPRGKLRDPAEVAGGSDIAAALLRIRDAAATPGMPGFLTAGDGSGSHLAEQALWRAARVAPAAPWYQKADAATPLLAQARARGAYALVERGVWDAAGGAPLAVLVEGDTRMVVQVHAMRAFRVSHPAAKIFLTWITGPKGRAAVATQRAYRAP